MQINNQSTLHGIKAEFHALFPYLKIEFYKHDHPDHEVSPKTDQLISDAKISDIAGHNVQVDIRVSPEMKVNEFESLFYKATGVGVQVFRNSNGVWLQTSSTDEWSLAKQNGKGERSESDYDIEPVDISDFDVE